MTTDVVDLYAAFARYGSGVCLVTTRDGDEDRFFIAASVLTASVDPFHLAVSVGRNRDALPALLGDGEWNVTVLADRHEELTRTLTSGIPRDDRVQAILDAGAARSAAGTLYLRDGLALFRCQTVSSVDVADQILLVARVNAGKSGPDGDRPLLRWNREFGTTAVLV